MKTSVKIIHARLHAQALTLAALAGAAVVEYYDHKSGQLKLAYKSGVGRFTFSRISIYPSPAIQSLEDGMHLDLDLKFNDLGKHRGESHVEILRKNEEAYFPILTEAR
ncbi:hypoxia induced protein conserved regioncontaining protein [Striga asiatica]|uniref:Hypoxia induced protein conserved regioncontaining protein n=1 Tax=Striga asiatica TaxID=4170 RepID=A0A5A7RIA1_STRAF|nr:hypoxia induced protein conserved regioncontaining protein [Striga asiatica]